jgi:hypothetical protein
LANRSKLTVSVGGMSSAAHDLTGVFDAHSIGDTGKLMQKSHIGGI